MAQNETEPTGSAYQSCAPPDNAIKDRKTILTAKRLETVVAVLLGVTTLLSAWASWIAHLHGGLQSINFTESNNAASEATAQFNYATQAYLADYMTWNTLRDYSYELAAAKAEGNQTRVDLLTEKIEDFKKQNVCDILAEGIQWMEENDGDSPFNMPGILDKYSEAAYQAVEESQKKLADGKNDNTKGDSYMLVTVIYSLVLFLLGIVGTFKNLPNRIAVLSIAVVCLVAAFIYMCTIPLPTGFSNMNFFEFK